MRSDLEVVHALFGKCDILPCDTIFTKLGPAAPDTVVPDTIFDNASASAAIATLVIEGYVNPACIQCDIPDIMTQPIDPYIIIVTVNGLDDCRWCEINIERLIVDFHVPEKILISDLEIVGTLAEKDDITLIGEPLGPNALIPYAV
jgi:hypothetical protein